MRLLYTQTGLVASDIDIIVTTCSIFCPTPSLSSMVVNHFKMREDIQVRTTPDGGARHAPLLGSITVWIATWVQVTLVVVQPREGVCTGIIHDEPRMCADWPTDERKPSWSPLTHTHVHSQSPPSCQDSRCCLVCVCLHVPCLMNPPCRTSPAAERNTRSPSERQPAPSCSSCAPSRCCVETAVRRRPARASSGTLAHAGARPGVPRVDLLKRVWRAS